MSRHLKRAALLAAASAGGISLHGAVVITSVVPSAASPQPYGTPVTFAVTATDTNPGPLTFKFSVAFQTEHPVVYRNFDIGTLNAGVWNSQPFIWTHIAPEGAYTITVVAKDFVSGESASQSIPYRLTNVVSANKLTVVATQHPLVALAAVPACPSGSFVRVFFHRAAGNALTFTGFLPCDAPRSSSFYLGGLYPDATYSVGYQIQTSGVNKPGSSTATFTAGSLPPAYTFPVGTLVEGATPQADLSDDLLLHSNLNLAPNLLIPPAATDLLGNTVWYYPSDDPNLLLTRPIPGGHFLLLEKGTAWNDGSTQILQLVHEVDLAGNVNAETNIGLLQQQLLAMGATDMQSCGNIPIPAPIGSACLAGFSHDAILLPNGDWAMIASIEKIFPPGTQGNTSGLNVDVLGDSIVVVNQDLNVVWYWDSFQHDGGGTQLDINRAATLGETCSLGQGGCPPMFLISTPGIANPANDWMHSNSLYFDSDSGDFILSMRDQDWVAKIDFRNGKGTGNILWLLGLDGSFTFNNVTNDPYPWFSHQHDVAIENTGEYTVFDNGDTRVAEMGGNSRGVALTVDESTMTVTPVLLQDLGYYSFVLGSAQLLANGNYHFQNGLVQPADYNYSQEYSPMAGTVTGTEVYNLQENSPSYRSFRMEDLYHPPAN